MSPVDQSSAPLAGKRVLIVLGCLDLGGAERQAVHAASCLRDRQQAEVQVWAFRPAGRAARLCDRLGIPWRFVPEPWGRGPLRWPMMIVRFARALRRERPDFLLPYTAFPNVICGLSWRLAGASVCIWNQRDAGLGLGSPAVPWAVRNTPLFLSNSSVGRDFLVGSLGVAPRRVRVVRNAVRLDPSAEDRAAWRARLGADSTSLVACMVANLQEHKDHATLLRAWRTVSENLSARGRRALLALAGRLDAPEDLQSSIQALRLEAAVRLLGEVEDVSGLLSAADLSVFSSRSEGCPNGVLEAMAAGLPVVATDCPGVREAAGELAHPWLAPPGDAEAIARSVLRLADDAPLRAQLGSANARRIQSEFSFERLNADLARLLSAALATRRWP
jgi:glycosyltransferase involved in cell wall biosynthesis